MEMGMGMEMEMAAAVGSQEASGRSQEGGQEGATHQDAAEARNNAVSGKRSCAFGYSENTGGYESSRNLNSWVPSSEKRLMGSGHGHGGS